MQKLWILSLLTVVAQAHAGAGLNGVSLNGLALNGIATNGIATNGIATNGIATNGIATNRVKPNFSGLNGAPRLDGVLIRLGTAPLAR